MASSSIDDEQFSYLKRVPNPFPETNEGDSDDEEWHDAADEAEATSANVEAGPSSRSRPGTPTPERADVVSEEDDLFRDSDWQGAMDLYLKGLRTLPARRDTKGKGKDRASSTEKHLGEEDERDRAFNDGYAIPKGGDGNTPKPGSGHDEEGREEEENEVKDTSPLGLARQQCAVVRSVLNSNIAACHVKLGDHKTAVDYCTDSLLDVPTYSKALHRRATSNDALNTWTSLSSAEKDYQTLLDTLPNNSPLLPSVRSSLGRLKPRLEQAQKKETEEMMNKLKGLGNSILGRFGLSTDNFQFTPNGQGGYSMNFNQ